MLLKPADTYLFYRLNRLLLLFANQRLKMLSGSCTTIEDLLGRPLAELAQLRDAVIANPDVISAFVDENPAQLTVEELEIVDSWRNAVSDDFCICRELKKHAVFLKVNEPIAYGVVGLTQTFREIFGSDLPVMVHAVLLPFQGQIIYDGLLSPFEVDFDLAARRAVNVLLQEAKKLHGFVTSLPMSDKPRPPKPARARPIAKETPAKQDQDEAVQSVIALVDQFCMKHLNKEYAELSRKLAEKLARKRPSPLLKGSPNAWASGIVRVIGGVNFLHDKTLTPYMRAADIDQHLGCSSSTAAARAAEIRKLLKIRALDPQWTLPSRLDDNPMVWMLEVNGFVIDVRRAARELQEQAYLQGLIPYIPADRE